MSKLEALFIYRDAEQERNQIDAELRSTPARRQANRLYKALKDESETIKRLNAEIEVRSAQAKKLAEHTAQLQNQLELENSELETMLQDEETTAEEMTELRGDIERLNKEIQQAAKEAKALAALLETNVNEYRTTGVEYTKNKKEYDALRVTCEQEKAEAAQRVAAVDAKLEKLAKDVDPDLLAKYKRSVLHNANAIVPVKDSKCSGCFMSLPMAVLKKLAQQDATVECENCGRVLYAELPDMQ